MEEAKTLYLLLTITFLALLTALFLPVSQNYRLALFTTVGLPVIYSSRYFSEHREYKFFRNLTLRAELIRDITAITVAYVIGYIVYVATSADFSVGGLFLYSIAFIVALILKRIVSVWYSAAKGSIIDPDNPLVIVIVSITFAVVGLCVEFLFFNILR